MVMHLGSGNLHYQYKLEDEGTEHKNLGVLVDGKLDTSQQFALAAQKASCIHRLHHKMCGQQDEGGDPAPLL